MPQLMINPLFVEFDVYKSQQDSVALLHHSPSVVSHVMKPGCCISPPQAMLQNMCPELPFLCPHRTEFNGKGLGDLMEVKSKYHTSIAMA